MPAAGRVGDIAWIPADKHGCNGCPHAAQGPAQRGSSDVYINGQQALRVGDPGVHAQCCGSNTWKAGTGAPGVFFNDIAAHRLSDQTEHCGGRGVLVTGSPNVIIGDKCGVGGPPGRSPPPTVDKLAFCVETIHGDPVPDLAFEAMLPDGTTVQGSTDSAGQYTCDTVVGSANVTFTIRFPVIRWER